MHAEVLSIGDELTAGLSLDTNSRWLSRRLHELGIWVTLHTTVADELPAITDTLRAAIQRSDVVVVTGGLGPTADDLTRQALAAAVGRRLSRDEASLEHIRCLFARRGRTMPPQNTVQAMLPEGSRPIPNPAGTAPGIAMEIPRSDRASARIYCLPGVPAEMREMWTNTVEYELRALPGPRPVIRHRRLRCFGAGESAIEAMLPDLIRRVRQPRVGITASRATITLTVTAEGPTEEDCLAAMEPTIATIRDCLGNLVFGEGDDELEDALVRLLRARGTTLAVAECATAGSLIERLQAAAGEGPEIAGGLVLSGRRSLGEILGIPADAIPLDWPPPDADTAARLATAMAVAARCKFAADYAVAVGPRLPLAPAADATGPLAFALATPGGTQTKTIPIAGHPALQKTLCVKTALNVARLAMLLPTP